MSKVSDDLAAAVAEQKSVDASIETLLNSISAQLAVALANDDTAAIQQMVDDLKSNTVKMKEAVVRNTPVTPEQAAQPAPAEPPAPAQAPQA